MSDPLHSISATQPGRGRRSFPDAQKQNAQNSVVSHCYGVQNGGEVTDLVRLHVWVRREAELQYYS